jgi:ATPase subunit of ABC transporter with duplicated ATPase domains
MPACRLINLLLCWRIYCRRLQFDHDADQERLNEVYERMAQISGSTAEARASKILHGLGFTESMQKRPTQSFR